MGIRIPRLPNDPPDLTALPDPPWTDAGSAAPVSDGTVVFAYRTQGEALMVANSVLGKKLAVCEVRLIDGFRISQETCCWLVLPAGALEL
jgi:hypothetical protein